MRPVLELLHAVLLSLLEQLGARHLSFAFALQAANQIVGLGFGLGDVGEEVLQIVAREQRLYGCLRVYDAVRETLLCDLALEDLLLNGAGTAKGSLGETRGNRI